MKYKIAYSYHQSTGEYTGQEAKAWESPNESGVFHLPAHTTYKKPPNAGTGNIALWNGQDWNVVPNHRFKSAYNADTGENIIIDYLGELKLGHYLITKEEQEALGSGEKDAVIEGSKLVLVDHVKTSAEETAELEAYLSGTDWYAVRFAETGESIPADVGEARAEARKRISELREEI